MKTVTRFLCGLVFLISGINVGYAQMIRSQNSNISVQDTTKAISDTSKNHLKLSNGKDTVVMKSDSGIETVVTIVANDSSWNEVSKNIIHLYSGAKVKYQDFELSADYIRLDRNTNMLYASGVPDHTGKYVGRPVVLFPNETPKAVDSLLYNYKSQEGKTFGIMTEEDGGYIQARVLRKNIYDEMSIQHAMYSTCDLPFPHTHFGIAIPKGLITSKQVIAEWPHLVVQGIPFKFITVPFGFFPKTNKKQAGFLFPSFGDDVTRGFGLRDFGWYLTFNDFWDSELRGSFYSKGAWESSIRTNYMVNYKYSGGFNIRFASTPTGVEGSDSYQRAKDFNVTWTHTQRQEANPGTSFSASVNFGTSSYFQNSGAGSTYNYNELTRNNMSSSISYGKVFADGKVNFTSSATHRQDMQSGKVDLELPQFALNVSTFNPFESKERVGEPKWYERITVGYSLQGRNSLSTGDSTIFTKQTLKQFTNGFQHNIPVSLSLNAFKYFQFNTSVNYTERWYLQTIRNYRGNELNGYINVKDTVGGFRRAYDYSMSSGLSTKVYGMMERKIGNIEAIRHVITPSINFNYRPDFGDPKYGFYREWIDQNGRLSNYSIFEGAIFGGPSSGESMGIGFSVDNNIEAKIRNKSDSTDTEKEAFKKIPILQGLTFSGNYNFAADSLKLSTISFSGRTSLFNEKINLNFNGTLDPYQLDNQGQRIDRFTLKDGNLARLTNFGVSFDYTFNPDASKSRNNNLDSMRNQMPNMTKEQSEALARISRDPNAFVDFNIPWNLAGSFSLQYFKRFDTEVRRERSDYSATVNLHGDISVTPKWKIQFNSGYDLRQKEVAMTNFSIYRDLHCWDMSVGWVPFGRYQSYNITIRAKASVLQDLKLTKRNSHYSY